MSDIVEKLRSWVYTDSLYATAIEAAEEIERLRQVVEQKNITDAERWALKYFAAFDRSPRERDAAAAATIRSLLSRTGSDLRQTCDEAIAFHSQGERNPERDRLTDAEREAIGRAIKTLDDWQSIGGYHELHDDDADTLRGLLERPGGAK